MTRKDYELIAGIISEEYNINNEFIAGQFVLRKLANKLANQLQQDNPRFDGDKFLKACGLQS